MYQSIFRLDYKFPITVTSYYKSYNSWEDRNWSDFRITRNQFKLEIGKRKKRKCKRSKESIAKTSKYNIRVYIVCEDKNIPHAPVCKQQLAAYTTLKAPGRIIMVNCQYAMSNNKGI